MKHIPFICIFIFVTSTAWAVNGYKDLLFGMSKTQVINSEFCTFSEDNPKKWYNWFRDFSRLSVYTCPDRKFGDRKIKVSLTLIDDRLHKITLVHAGSIEFNKMVLGLLMNKYGFQNGGEAVNLANTLYKFMDKAVEAELVHPPESTLFIHYFSDQFGWFMSKDPRDKKLINEL